MGIILNDSLRVNAPKPTDARYMKNETIPWVSAAEVNAAIPAAYRHRGLTVLIGDSEFWYNGGTADVNLVKKSNTDIVLQLAADGFYEFPSDVLVTWVIAKPNIDINIGLGAQAPGDLTESFIGANISYPFNIGLWRDAGQRIYFSGIAGSNTKVIIKTA